MDYYCLESPGSIDGIVRRQGPVPRFADTEVLVAVKANSLNYRDLRVAEGGPRGPVIGPLIPLSDGAGVVEAVGDRVTRFKAGDRVVGTFHQRWLGGPLRPEYRHSDLGGAVHGMLAQYVALDEEGLVPMPAHMSFEEAATLPCAAVTAWNALILGKSTVPGETVLVQGSGGVSLFALSFARMFGARVIAITSSPRKAELLRSLGAHEVIDYTARPDWHLEAIRLNGDRKLDRVLDMGGAGTLTRSVKATRDGGEIPLVGLLVSQERDFDLLDAIASGISMHNLTVGSRAHFEDMARAMELHEVRPVIDKVFPFWEAIEAYRYFQSRGHVGKVVISAQ